MVGAVKAQISGTAWIARGLAQRRDRALSTSTLGGGWCCDCCLSESRRTRSAIWCRRWLSPCRRWPLECLPRTAVDPERLIGSEDRHFFAIAAGDILQASGDYCIDNAAAAAPAGSILPPIRSCAIFYGGPRPAGTFPRARRGVSQAGSTVYPSVGVESGALLMPRLAQKAAIGSALMLTTTGLRSDFVRKRHRSCRLRIKTRGG